MNILSKKCMKDRFLFIAYTLIVLMFFITPAIADDEPALFIAWDDENLEWVACPDFFPSGCQLSFIHGDPAEPSADVLFKIPGGYHMVAHWHNSAERMVLMNGEMKVTYVGQDEATIKKGMYIYGPSRRMHKGDCISEEPCVLYVGFVGPVDAMDSATKAE